MRCPEIKLAILSKFDGRPGPKLSLFAMIKHNLGCDSCQEFGELLMEMRGKEAERPKDYCPCLLCKGPLMTQGLPVDYVNMTCPRNESVRTETGHYRACSVSMRDFFQPGSQYGTING